MPVPGDTNIMNDEWQSLKIKLISFFLMPSSIKPGSFSLPEREACT